MTHRNFLKSAIGVLLALATAATVSADPLVVTSGGFSFRFGGPSSISLTGDGFSLVSIHPLGHFNAFANCVNFLCGPGATLDLGATVAGFAEDHMPQTFNGITSSGPIFVAADLHFNAAMVVLPTSVAQRAFFSAPFTFDGTLSLSSEGRLANGRVELTGPTLFHASLTGQGTVSGRVIRGSDVGGSPGQFALVDLKYTFEQNAAPTPEPATAALIIAGVAFGAVKGRGSKGQGSPVTGRGSQ